MIMFLTYIQNVHLKYLPLKNKKLLNLQRGCNIYLIDELLTPE